MINNYEVQTPKLMNVRLIRLINFVVLLRFAEKSYLKANRNIPRYFEKFIVACFSTFRSFFPLL